MIVVSGDSRFQEIPDGEHFDVNEDNLLIVQDDTGRTVAAFHPHAWQAVLKK